MKDVVRDFIELVSISSSSKNERLIADRIKKMFNSLGINYIEDNTGKKVNGNSGNLIGKIKGKAGIEPILFSAHMDRVKNGDNIKPKIKDGKIISSGNTILAADDVAGIVSILHGIKMIKEEKREHGDIEIVFTVCEELGVQGSKYLDYSNLRSKMGFVFDSSGRLGRIINCAVGKSTVEVKIYGKSSHAGSEPEKGINAIIGASKFLADIEEGRINEITTSNFGKIQGGSATNVVCDYVQILGEIRSHDDKEIDRYKRYICEKAKEVEKNSKVKIDINFAKNYESFSINKNEEICEILQRSFEKLNINPKFEKGGGGMDANIFNSNNIKSVGIATGYKNNHSNEEKIIIEDLIKSADLVKEIIQTVSKQNKIKGKTKK